MRSHDREGHRGRSGGGSTELIRVEEGRDFDDVSIGQGSLSSYAGYVEFVMPQADEVEAIERAFLDQVAKTPVDLKKYRAETLYGVGGSARAAAKLYAQMTGESCRPRTPHARALRCTARSSGEQPVEIRPPCSAGRSRAHPHGRARLRHPQHAHAKSSMPASWKYASAACAKAISSSACWAMRLARG